MQQTPWYPKALGMMKNPPDSPRNDSSVVQEAVTYCLVLVMENLVNQNLSKVAQDINMASKTRNSKVQLLKLERV